MAENFVLELGVADKAVSAWTEARYCWRLIDAPLRLQQSLRKSSAQPFTLELTSQDVDAFLSGTPTAGQVKRLAGVVEGILRRPGNEFWESFLAYAGGLRQEPVIRLVIRFSDEVDSSVVFQVPWELVAGPVEVGRIDNVEPHVSVVRHWPRALRISGELSPPLRIIVLKGYPGEESDAIDLEDECAEIRRIVDGLDLATPGLVQLEEEWAREALLGALPARLPSQILVFLGHGLEQGGEVSLQFVHELTPEGRPRGRRLLSVSDFAHVLSQIGSQVRLVVLNACSSSGSSAAFEQGALALLGGGIGAVVAIQGRVKLETSRLFFTTFLQHLLEAWPVDEAVLAGRKVVAQYERQQYPPDLGGDWARPVLLLASLERDVFALAPTFEPSASRRRRQWREILGGGVLLSAEEEELKTRLLEILKKPGAYRIVEATAGESHPALRAAVTSLLVPSVAPVPLYRIELPQQAGSLEPLLAELWEQALAMEDEDLAQDCQYVLAKHRDELRDLRSLGEELRMLLVTGCTDVAGGNAPAWQPLLEQSDGGWLRTVIILAGTAPAGREPAFGLRGGRLRPAPPPFSELGRLPLSQFRLLEALALLRQPASPATLGKILEDPTALADLRELQKGSPNLLHRVEGSWALEERARETVAAQMDPSRGASLHHRAAQVFLEEAGG